MVLSLLDQSLYDSNTKAYLPSKRILPFQENGIGITGYASSLMAYCLMISFCGSQTVIKANKQVVA